MRGRRAPGEIIDFSFYLHRGRSAEDPRRIRGRSAEDPRGRHLRKATGVPPGGPRWPAEDPPGKATTLLGRPPRGLKVATGRPRKIPWCHLGATGWPPGGRLPGGHWVAGHRGATAWPPIKKKQFCLHRGRSASTRKIRGRPPRKS